MRISVGTEGLDDLLAAPLPTTLHGSLALPADVGARTLASTHARKVGRQRASHRHFTAAATQAVSWSGTQITPPGTNGAYGGDLFVYPAVTVEVKNQLTAVAVYYTGDLVQLNEIVINVYGTSMNFMALGALGHRVGMMSPWGTASLGLLMRWE